MALENLTLEIRSLARRLGADAVGIAPMERFSRAPEGHRPEDMLPGARSVIAFALRLLESTFYATNPRVWVHRYWQLRSRLQDMGYDLCRYLEDRGYYAINLPSTAPMEVSARTRLLFGDFSHRHAAVEAGLGEIGWNQLLITPQFGPRVWLMSVITTAELEPNPRWEQPLCPREKCNLCIEGCPQGALSPQGIDRARCLRAPGEYGLYDLLRHLHSILEEKDEEKRNQLIFGPDTWGIWMHMQYGGGASRCGECVRVCPVGKKGLK